jgi:membrane-associated phospholipid phosphatase
MPAFRGSLYVLAALWLSTAQAEGKTAADYFSDLHDYAAAPLHWDTRDWEWVAGAAAGVAGAYSLDTRVHAHFADGRSAPQGDPHSLRDAAPAAVLTLGTLAFGALRHDSASTQTGIDMVEAIGLGGMSAFVLKSVTARARPDATTDRAAWGSGGDSFPSGHVTAAFAAAEVFAESRPADEWRWRALAYSLAVATAYARLDSNMHWGSDTVAGAALGIATGRFVASRRSVHEHSRVSVWVEPLDHGAMLSFSIDPR